jgi:hypothetical protein
MDPNEQAQILALLEDGKQALLTSLEGVTGQTAARIPAEGRWSILGVVEHMGISEDYLFGQILKATPTPSPIPNPTREAKMLAFGADRSRRIASPPEGFPQGRFPTLAAALDYFLATRARTVAFVQSNPENLRSQLTWHPILGDANSHEMLLSICVHALRHAKQIEEIKSQLN